MNRHRRITLLGLAAVPLLIREALAQGQTPVTNGFHTVKGKVLLNDRPATAGTAVMPGDRVATGPEGMAIFVQERDAFLIRGNGRFEISQNSSGGKILRLTTGKLLSVFGKGEKRIELPNATIGIRGTAAYVEADPEASYVCTCYGTAEIQARDNPAVRELVTTKHHDAPRYIRSGPGTTRIESAPVINHTDEELIMLEALVGRYPPFYTPWKYINNEFQQDSSRPYRKSSP